MCIWHSVLLGGGRGTGLRVLRSHSGKILLLSAGFMAPAPRLILF